MSIHTLFKYSLTAITMMLLALTAQTTTTFAQTNGSRNEAAVASASPVATASPNPDAPATSLSHTVRVGIDASAPVALTLQEAIRLGLANNNDIATSRIDVELSEHNLTAERGVYDPVLKSEYKFDSLAYGYAVTI